MMNNNIIITSEQKALIESSLQFLIDTIDFGLDENSETNKKQHDRAIKIIRFLNKAPEVIE